LQTGRKKSLIDYKIIYNEAMQRTATNDISTQGVAVVKGRIYIIVTIPEPVWTLILGNGRM